MYPKPFKRPDRKNYYFFYTFKGKRKLKNTQQKKLSDAQKFIREFIDRLHVGSHLTFQQYATPYTSWETSPKVKRMISEGKQLGTSYLEIQAYYFKEHIFPDEISRKPIRDITPGDVIDFRTRIFSKLIEKPNTANKVFVTFKMVLSEASLRGDIPTNPGVGIGNIIYKKQEKKILSQDEIKNLFAVPWGIEKKLIAYQVFRFAAWTGMRKSEVLALHWEQLDGDILTIDKAWKTRTTLGPPKSGKSRTIPLAPSVLENLPEKKHDLIFCYPDGTRLYETWWRKNWNDIVVGEKETEDGKKVPIKL